jgi:hypothetical protein
VRDAADVRYALMLKSRILGENPCNVELIFKKIKQFGGQARQAGGVCAVENGAVGYMWQSIQCSLLAIIRGTLS